MEEWEDVSLPQPVNGGRRVAVVVEIRCNATGEVREYETDDILRDGADDPGDYLWSEGNYGCDCNRAAFFADAGGEDDIDCSCGEGRYSIRVRNKKSGRVWYREWEA